MNETIKLLLINYAVNIFFISAAIFIFLPAAKKGMFKNEHYWTGVITFYFFLTANLIYTIYLWGTDNLTKLEAILDNITLSGFLLSAIMFARALITQGKRNNQVENQITIEKDKDSL
jgi:hypothetical protein